MKRKFNTFSKIGIKNKDKEKDFHIPQYRNRKQTSETIKPEVEEIFEISAFGSSAYYYKNTLGRNVEVTDLYDDGQTPKDSYKLTIVNNSKEIIYVDLDKDLIKSIDKGESETLLLKFSELPYYIYLSDGVPVEDFQAIFSGLYNGESYQSKSLYIRGHAVISNPEEATDWYISQSGEGILTVNDKSQKQYIYEKGEDSDVEFDLHHHGNLVQPGTNLTIGNEYTVLTFLDQGDIFINDVLKAENKDKLIFTLTEDMSVNNKVVITVKRHETSQGSDIILSSGDEVVDAEGNDLTVDGGEPVPPEPPTPEGKFKVINNSNESIVRVKGNGVTINVNKNSEGSFDPRDDGSSYWFYVERDKQISAYYTGEYHGVNYIDRRLTIDP